MESIKSDTRSGPATGGPPSPDAFLALCASLLPTDEEPTLESNLFELGADSLTITALAAEIQARWGVTLGPSDLFLAEDIAEVYARVLAVPEADVPALPPRPAGAPLPSWEQLARLRPDAAGAGPAPRDGTVEVELRASGRLDERLLAAALRAVAGRHEVLRSVRDAGGGIVLRDEPEAPLDGAAGGEPAPGGAAGNGAADPASEAGASAPAPWRARIERVERGTVLSLSLDRLVADEGSVPILLADLARAYQSGAAQLPPARPDFYDWAAWQRAAYPAEEPGPAPARRPVARTASRATWPARSVAALDRLAEQCGAGLEDVLALVLGLALANRGRADEPVRLCVPLANRDDVRTRELVGPVQTRGVVTPAPDATVPVVAALRALRAARDDLASLAPVPYGRAPRPDATTGTPAALVSLRTGHSGVLRLGAVRCGWTIRAQRSGYSGVPLALEGGHDDDGNLELVLWHDPDHVDTETAQGLLSSLSRLADAVLAGRNEPVARIAGGQPESVPR